MNQVFDDSLSANLLGGGGQSALFQRSRSLRWKFQSLLPETSLRKPAGGAVTLAFSSAAPMSSRSAEVMSSKTASAPSSSWRPPRNTVPAYMLSARPNDASPHTI